MTTSIPQVPRRHAWRVLRSALEKLVRGHIVVLPLSSSLPPSPTPTFSILASHVLPPSLLPSLPRSLDPTRFQGAIQRRSPKTINTHLHLLESSVAFHRALKEGGREEGREGETSEEAGKEGWKEGGDEEGREGRVEAVIRELLALATGKMLMDPPGREGEGEGRADRRARGKKKLNPTYASFFPPFPPSLTPPLPPSGAVVEFYASDWTADRPHNLLVFGHVNELLWLVVDACEVRHSFHPSLPLCFPSSFPPLDLWIYTPSSMALTLSLSLSLPSFLPPLFPPSVFGHPLVLPPSLLPLLSLDSLHHSRLRSDPGRLPKPAGVRNRQGLEEMRTRGREGGRERGREGREGREKG